MFFMYFWVVNRIFISDLPTLKPKNLKTLKNLNNLKTDFLIKNLGFTSPGYRPRTYLRVCQSSVTMAMSKLLWLNGQWPGL